MATPTTLSLNKIVNVVVTVSPLAAPRNGFNQGLIIGPSAVIPATERLRFYSNVNDMLTDGFTNTSPEYLAAQIYFSQSPAPTQLWVGRQNLVSATATTNCATTIGSAVITPASMVGIEAGMTITGTGIPVGATVLSKTATTITMSANATATNAATSLIFATPSVAATASITTSSAVVTPVSMTGIYVGQTVTGTGIPANSVIISVTPTTFTMNNTATATNAAAPLVVYNTDSALSALQACRLANSQWYPCFVCNAVKADHLAIAAYIETATPASTYFGTTADIDVPTATAGNVLLTLQGLLYTRTFMQYSTSTPYAICGAMGYAMGQNTGLAGSAYTLKFKNEVGVTVEPLSSTQMLNVENANGNLYLNYGYYYNIFEQGVSSAGRFFDEVLNLDMLANNIQLNIMDTLYQNPKVPQTDAGVLQLIRACNQACDLAVNVGFLAPGVWTGLPILNLATDQTLPKGYLVQAPAISTQSDADRQARKSPPLYIAIKEAGAIHSVLIGVYVNR